MPAHPELCVLKRIKTQHISSQQSPNTRLSLLMPNVYSCYQSEASELPAPSQSQQSIVISGGIYASSALVTEAELTS